MIRTRATGGRLVLAALVAAAGLGARQAQAQTAPTPDLSQLSIEQLGDVEVTSVSKRPESIGQAAAAIYVISHDEIVRSGALTIPEMLRLAPNLEVFQQSSSQYVVTARGFNGAPAAQNFSNKLLVLIDGRSVYTPLFSGVYWDAQDVTPEDIDRIEVISGPGATLWGANAVNGVINIITRTSSDTQGGLIQAQGGSQEGSVDLRYGGRLGERATFRIYGRGYYGSNTRDATGASAVDAWSKPQGGFRLDWNRSSADLITLQGDIYDGREDQAGGPDQTISGGNLVARWNHGFAGGGQLQVQTYFDRAVRGDTASGTGFSVNTLDLDIQHSFRVGGRNDVVVGGGVRQSRYNINGLPNLFFTPSASKLTLVNIFAQDTFTVNSALRLIVGVKVEDDPYVSAHVLPNVRLVWTPAPNATAWIAGSRAIRSPTPFDRDVVEKLGGAVFLIGGPDFQPEQLDALEVGGRFNFASRASLSVSAYFNDYDDLRSIEVAPGGFLPLRWGNGMEGQTWGVEAWGDFQVAPWWRVSPSVAWVNESFTFIPGASGILGVSQAANDPKFKLALKSSMDFGRFTFDAMARHITALPDPAVPAFTELSAKVRWAVTDHVDLSVSGQNLLHARHVEYPQGNAIPRSVVAGLTWRF